MARVIDYLMGDMKHKLLFCWVSNLPWLPNCFSQAFLTPGSVIHHFKLYSHLISHIHWEKLSAFLLILCTYLHRCYNWFFLLSLFRLFQDLSHCTPTGFKTLENKHKTLVFKDLKKLWEKQDPDLPWEMGEYNESNTLLLDDSPYKALLNPVSSLYNLFSRQMTCL